MKHRIAPITLRSKVGTHLDEYRAGGKRWVEVSEALFSRLRGSTKDTAAALRRAFPKSYHDYTARPIAFVPWLTRQLCQEYTEDPVVTYIDPSTGKPHEAAVVEQIKRIRKASGAREALQDAHEVMTATGNGVIMVKPVMRQFPGRGAMTGVRVVSLPPHDQAAEMTAHPVSQDERDITAWWSRLPLPGSYNVDNGMMSYGLAYITPELAIWGEAEHDLKNKAIWPGSEANPIQEVPVCVIRWNQPRPGEFFGAAREDLREQAAGLDVQMTDLCEIARTQGYGQWVSKGLVESQAGSIRFGPKVIAALMDKEAELQNVAQNADLQGMLMQMEAALRIAVASNDINPATLIRSTAQTAAAKLLELVDREHLRKRHLAQLRRCEQRIYDLTRKWLRWLRKADVLPEAIVQVEYPKPEVPADPLHEVQSAERRIALTLSSPPRERMKVEKGITFDEAMKRCEEDRVATIKLRGSLPTPGGGGLPSDGDGAGDASDDTDNDPDNDDGRPRLSAVD